MRTIHLFCVALAVCIAAACARAPETSRGGRNPSGTWVGDFGPAFYDRNTIALDLQWNGTTLTGTIQPGDPRGRMYRNFAGFPIENASFDPETGVLKFEATFKPKSRRYVIEGKLAGNTLSGAWNRPEEPGKDGDFKLKRQ